MRALTLKNNDLKDIGCKYLERFDFKSSEHLSGYKFLLFESNAFMLIVSNTAKIQHRFF
jgi:hypothetical protein